MFSCFAHFTGKIATRSADPRSDGKRTFIKTLLFIHFAHFGEKCVAGLADPRSHDK